MAFALLIMCLWHPGRTLVGPEAEFPKLSRQEKKAIKKAKKAEKAERKAAKIYIHGQNADIGPISPAPVRNVG